MTVAIDEVHVTPVTDEDEPQHAEHGFCWCQPLVEDVPGGRLYIHRRTLDSPHIEEDEEDEQ